MFKVLSTGPQALFQDRGRPGYAASGVTKSGAFDRLSHARAQHALGNSPDAVGIEILLGGFSFEVLVAATIIITGTDAPVHLTSPTGKEITSHTNTLIDVHPGERVSLGNPSYGLRAYLAVRGGFQIEKSLGSAATDVLSGIGPAPIKPGDVLHFSADIADPAWWPQLRQLPPLWKPTPAETLTVVLGPREDWFTKESLTAFFQQEFDISAESNRIGVRLVAQQPLVRARSGEIASEGMVFGSIQVPPSGHPVIFGPDHPVTGGYPVVAVLAGRSCDRATQLGAGDRVRFVLA